MKQIVKRILLRLGLLRFIKRIQSDLPVYRLPLNTTDKVKHAVFESMSEYEKYISAHQNEFEKRDQFEQALIHQFPNSFYVKAPNFLLNDKHTLYRLDKYIQDEKPTVNLRETLICAETGLSNRIRATLFAMGVSFNKQRLSQSDVYLTEAVTSLFNWMKPLGKTVVGSEFLGADTKGGELENGIMHQDLTKLSFSHGSFDLIICLEVLEHIPLYQKALNELARVTKKGGSVFITVPFIEQNEQTIIRASIDENGTIIHHLPPEYHGDPVNAEGGILCFQHFGWDIISHLKEAGFEKVKAHFVWWQNQLIIGRHMITFEAIK